MATDVQLRMALHRCCMRQPLMRIPVQPDDDDVILSAALDELAALKEAAQRVRDVWVDVGLSPPLHTAIAQLAALVTEL